MPYKKKTWAEKMNPHTSAKVEITERKFADVPLGARLLIATPTIVDRYIRKIPRGQHVTIGQMREDLASEYGAEYTCPVTCGIFVRIVAENAYEEYQAGKPLDELAPFWRMIDMRSKQTRKLTFGPDFLLERRADEGLPSEMPKQSGVHA